MSTLLVGNSSTSFAIADSTAAGKIEAFQFTSTAAGTIEELEFRTGSTANTGITSLILGVYADSSGTPGSILGQKTFSGVPGTNTWIKITGLSVTVVKSTAYWLAVLPIGAAIHYNTSVSSGGTGDKESSSASNTSLIATTWGSNFADGPIGFQALGTLAFSSVRPMLVAPTYFSPKKLYRAQPQGQEPKKEEEKLLTMLI